ncbi:MAG: ATP-binding protein [Chloroflexi bacterium]|nr:ATP-binding protein [Ardenticatenaceae bacterium]NOG35181.1 ATP-binding protein [Chloroflexota bacterium]GIK54553.1 MAG: hypothetical protein BroJett015_02160 [Chloroflexota bacterium]
MRTLRGRFILTHILPTLLVVPLASLIILYLVETQVVLRQLAADVQSQALLLAELLEEDSTVWQNSERARFFVARVSTAVTGDITLQSPDGAILAATNPQSPQPQAGNLPISNLQSQPDTGPGIPPDEQSRIFEPFYRSRAQTRFPQGMGLGLTIARDLVEAHSGQLTLESEGGKGSCFTIQLSVIGN